MLCSTPKFGDGDEDGWEGVCNRLSFAKPEFAENEQWLEVFLLNLYLSFYHLKEIKVGSQQNALKICSDNWESINAAQIVLIEVQIEGMKIIQNRMCSKIVFFPPFWRQVALYPSIF